MLKLNNEWLDLTMLMGTFSFLFVVGVVIPLIFGRLYSFEVVIKISNFGFCFFQKLR
jgi:hypothetical protein